ncbi:MAG: outer membrane protein assembly factor BamA [Bryobacteraceae bacterium]
MTRWGQLHLAALAICASGVYPFASAQTPPSQSQPSQPPPSQSQPAQQTPPKPQQPANPFEAVPQNQPQPAEPAQPARPQPPAQLETPKPPPTAPPPVSGEVIKEIDFRGARRIPTDTLKSMIMSKVGDIYTEDAIRRDFMILWNSGRFEDIRVETEPDPTGGLILRFVLTERRVIRSINYEGIHTVTVSEILDRFKERKVGLVVESQYDPSKVQFAAIVLKEFLAERGRQYAQVDPVIEQIPPSSLKVTFAVKEGPKVKVGAITVTGNQTMSSKWVIGAMKQLKPYGIPHSILFESLFAKTYDQSKLEYDEEKVRQAYQDKGYYEARVLDPIVNIVPKGGRGWRLPIIKMEEPGIYADITLPIEEGRLYHLHTMSFVGVKLFREPSVLMSLFGMREGDVFNTDKLRKGIENMRKLYGGFGYIDFVPEPDVEPVPNTDQIDLSITADEGKQFFIRRIDFSGNTTTRDKVIRRELLLDEGDMFNTNLWDLSILRLNQLGYFEPLKKEDAADIKRNPASNTVDITLKVKERGKNSIGLNGGVSGIAGSFVGLNYSTNNFLGLGETLSISSQLGTLLRSVNFGFTEPYLFDHPIQTGFTVYLSRYDFNQARQVSILTGQNLIGLYNSLGSQNLLNYVQDSRGFTTSLSYQLHRSFWRTSLTFGYDVSSVKTETTAATNYFQYIDFDGVYGPNALDGIRTTKITPGLTYNTVNHPINPTGGKSIYFSAGFASSVLGGNVNTFAPAIDVKYYRPSPLYHKNILAFHVLGTLITGYGGKEVPPFARSFMGGENDVRGFDWWSITPIAFIPTQASIPIYNNDGSPRTQQQVNGGTVSATPVSMSIPAYQLITPGGDAHGVFNFEYRIPIFGPITLAIFGDAGINGVLRPSELTLAPERTTQLNQEFPQAGFTGQVPIAAGTTRPVGSTGLEIQVLLPVVQAPFRVYFAYNPSTVREYVQPPIAADRSFFPNAATFNAALAAYGQEYPYFDRRTLFRFTVGRTF